MTSHRARSPSYIERSAKRAKNLHSTKVFVGYLPETISRKELTNLFDEYGEIVECDIVKDYAFVHFSKLGDAKKAVLALNGLTYKGNKLNVQISISKVLQQPGMIVGLSCYRCGEKTHWARQCPQNQSNHFDSYEENDRLRDPERLDGHSPRDSVHSTDLYSDSHFRPVMRPEMVLHMPLEWDHYERNRDPYLRPPPEYYRLKALMERERFARIISPPSSGDLDPRMDLR